VLYTKTGVPESLTSQSLGHCIIHSPRQGYLPNSIEVVLIQAHSPSLNAMVPIQKSLRSTLPYIARALRVLVPAPPLPPPIAPVRLWTILKGPFLAPTLLLLLSFFLSNALADQTGSVLAYAVGPRRSPVKKVKSLSAPVALWRRSADGLSGGSGGG
jgi:hypothetical protein